ncbi:MAG TPA: MBL fold metallo-hydrolase, partial [Spirochaetota bacterium]|nr:MBL fold metallo-hydrolase [Spirochaetota bacterium]
MNKKRILIVCAVLLVSAAASITSRASAEADPTVMKIGDISVIAIHTSDIEMSSELVKNGDKNEIGKYIPTGKISASINAYVVKTPSHTVLVDSGMGTNDALCAQMGKAGISPDDIDLILLTHGHFDHVGGLVNNGKAVFGKARVMMAEKEAAVYGNDAINEIPQDMRKYFIPGNTVINVYKERFSTFVPGSVIVEGITSVDLNGHTPGHSGFLVGSGKKALLIAGDFMHISALQLVHPDYSLVYDSDGSKAADARKKL